MDRERAAAHLRLAAEAELRQAVIRPEGSPPGAGRTARLRRIGRALTTVRALDDEVADQILEDFELALGVRQAGVQAGFPVLRGPPEARRRLRSAGAPVRVVPLGQLIPLRSQDAGGEDCDFRRYLAGDLPC